MEVFSQAPTSQYANIVSGNGVALNKQQAIVWTNDRLVYWRICASSAQNELR